MRKECLVLLLVFVMSYLSACSSEQVKSNLYYSVHEKQRQDCIRSGQKDCSQYDYDSYDEYQRKKHESESEKKDGD